MSDRSADVDEGMLRPDNRLGRLITYRYGLPIGLLAAAAQLTALADHLSAFDRVALPLLIGVLAVLAVLVWLRLPLQAADHTLLVTANVYVVARLAFNLAAPDLPARSAVIGNGMPWVVLLLLMNDWLLSRKMARQVNVGMVFGMALCVLAWWPAGTPGAEQDALRGMLVQLLLASTTLLVVQAVMARHAADVGRHARQALHDATVDVLTGVPNRRALTQHLEARAAQPGTLAVALIDVDHFKSVNDRHGHARGDDVLRGVAQALRGGLGPRGVLGRYGGEEFLAVLDVCDEDGARRACEDLRARIEQFPIAGVPVTVSVGLAVCEAPVHPLNLLESADAALYRAKAQGRNRVQVTVLLRPVGAPPLPPPAPSWSPHA